MPLNDTLKALATGIYTVTRSDVGTYVDGVYTGGTNTTTFTISAVLEPAAGLQRVTGGFEMISGPDGQKTDDIRVLYTETLLHARTPTQEPDQVSIGGVNYTVWRVEPWTLTYYGANAQSHYLVMCTRQTNGAS